jgi:SAM-dependent methyltransferase
MNPARHVGRYLWGTAAADQQWLRRQMDSSIAGMVEPLGPSTLDAVEVSGDAHARWPWRSYETLGYPDFDLCLTSAAAQFDVVLCEQVLEHLADPFAAAEGLHDLARPGGHVIVSVPFLLRIHRFPEDYWRFAPKGLETLLERARLEVLELRSWGNRAAVRGNLSRFTRTLPWRSLKDDPDCPLEVWALARRVESDTRQHR